MKWINYHHLIYFKEIARLGSISKASKHLKVGQPALSSQLKKLEEYLQVELFERKNRKLILTEVGKVTLEYAERISELGQELIHVIDKKAFTKRIHLNVGAVDAIPKHLVSDILDFAHKKTGCFLSIFEGEPDYLLRELNAHRIDIIIADQSFGSSLSKNIFSKQIIKSQVSAYATEKFGGLKKGFPGSLSGEPCIMPTDHSKLRMDLEHFFHLNNIFVDQIAETQDSMLQKILSVKGDGIIFLPDFAAKEMIDERKLIKLGTLTGVNIQYYLVYSQKIIENPAVDLLIKQKLKI